ncbi:ferredoxin [Rhodococcus sp. ACS1]|uniref:ferredoxin n=1 Tax=Rhodococcus sp. ACS1 TaxID=2028570 RepID=UPI0015CDEF1A
MRIAIDDSRCLGHTMCIVAASELIEIDPVSEHAKVRTAHVPSGQEGSAWMAASGCPEQAISVIEE